MPKIRFRGAKKLAAALSMALSTSTAAGLTSTPGTGPCADSCTIGDPWVIAEEDKRDEPGVIDVDPALTLKTLREGGFVILVRHTARDNLEGRPLWQADRTDTCIRGSELNEEGKLQARIMRDAFERERIPVGEVVATPTCRARQVAELAFGKLTKTDWSLVYWPVLKPWEWHEHNVGLREHLSRKIPDKTNRILSSHNNALEALRIRGLPTRMLGMGDIAVIRPLGNNRFKYKGNITHAAVAAVVSSGSP
jgi:hypothetical protein